MTLSDRERILRLRSIFDTNYKVTHLYASFLDGYTHLITKELVESLKKEADLSVTDAVAVLLCEIFGLDIERDPAFSDDRKIIMDYIYPALRFHRAADYENNPYYKNVAPRENFKDGNWEFKWEYYPPYRAAIGNDVIIKENYREIFPLCFFEDGFSFPAVLEDGNEWMTLTPVDVDTSVQAIEKARGKVVTFGLGLGYFAYMASEKDSVESVTVVEKSENVIRLFRKHILPKFDRKEKIRIVNMDAFEYAEKVMPNEKFDYAFVDTWRDASDGLPMYEKMKALEELSPTTEFDYWIENFIISRRRAIRFEELWDALTEGRADAPESYSEFIERLNR